MASVDTQPPVRLATRADVAKLHQLLTEASRAALRVRGGACVGGRAAGLHWFAQRRGGAT